MTDDPDTDAEEETREALQRIARNAETRRQREKAIEALASFGRPACKELATIANTNFDNGAYEVTEADQKHALKEIIAINGGDPLAEADRSG